MNIHEKSKKAYQQSLQFFAGGVGSNGRVKPELGYPVFFTKGKGARIYDLDGNGYIDYHLAMGPLILGHCPKRVIEAVKKQLASGTIFGSSVIEESLLSEEICRCLPSVELVRFTNSGSEAVHMTLRLARAYTEKSKILKFEGAYHGWFDDIWVSVHPSPSELATLENDTTPVLQTPGQSRRALKEVLVAPWNRLDTVEKIVRRHRRSLAAIILEPIMCNNGVIPPAEGFLKGLRAISDREGIVLIFDETITAFRAQMGGAQAHFDVKPDLTVFGKSIGGGYPIAGFGGSRQLMSLVADGKVGHFGTYNSNPLCVTAALATLHELNEGGGTAYSRMTELGCT